MRKLTPVLYKENNMNTTYRKRREKLLKDKKAPYFAVFYGVNNPDLPLPFDRNFYYFTGLKNVTQVLVIKKDENGNPIEDPLDCIIYDANGNELKAWKAVCDYLTSFSKNEQGISEVPEYYRTTQNRKVVTSSFSPRAMFKNTIKYFYIIVGIVLLIILIFFIIICYINKFF